MGSGMLLAAAEGGFSLLRLLIDAAASWVVLVLVVRIGGRIADITIPPWPETLWKLAVVAAVSVGVGYGLDQVNGFLSIVGTAIVFWTFMVKWFDADFFAACVLTVISWFVKFGLILALMAVFRD